MKLQLALLALCACGAALALPGLLDDTLDVQRQDIIDEVNSANGNWVAGNNTRFFGMSIAEFKRTHCGVLGGPRPRLMRMAPKTNVTALPTDFDARSNWGHCKTISQIRDQSMCGSCWAFGAVEAQADRMCIASKGKFNSALSAQDMTSCCVSCGMGCNGGYPESAWQYWHETGLVTEAAYPYELPSCDHHVTGSKPPCGPEKPTPQCNKHKISGVRFKGLSAYSVRGSIQDMMQEIVENGPVEGAFTVYEDFVTYKSGVYKHTTGSMLGGHAIKVMGYGTEGGEDYWLVANSWNEDWGDKGTFKIARGNDECGIEDGLVAGQAPH
jgi:cathepsin B